MQDNTVELRLLIVSNEPLARAGLSSLLTDQPGLEVVGLENSYFDIDPTLKVFSPDVILWDLGWEPSPRDDVVAQNDLEHISALSSEGIPVVALISSPGIARDAWAAGARGILVRDVDVDTLVTAVLAMTSNLVVLDPSIGANLLPTLSLGEHVQIEDLTPREVQVLQQLAEGLPNKAIANQLGVSEHTIKFHTNSIFRKLDVRSRTEAVVRASQLGLILL